MDCSPVLLALGSNLPFRGLEPAEIIEAALAELGRDGFEIKRLSRLYASPAWPDPKDPAYVNAVVRIGAAPGPQRLLARLQAIESAFGRVCSPRNAPRTLDLDILDYNGRTESGPPVLPHPRMHLRAFVLIPLAELSPGWRHPVLGSTVEELLARLTQRERGAIVPIGPGFTGS